MRCDERRRLQRLRTSSCCDHFEESNSFGRSFKKSNNLNIPLFRNVLGTKNLGDILSERESIAHELHELLYEATEPWGVQVERVEVNSRCPLDIELGDIETLKYS